MNIGLTRSSTYKQNAQSTKGTQITNNKTNS